MFNYPCRLRNATTRPVEIHSKDKVEIINPGMFITLYKPNSNPILQQLIRDGVLTCHDGKTKQKNRKKRIQKTNNTHTTEEVKAHSSKEEKETEAREIEEKKGTEARATNKGESKPQDKKTKKPRRKAKSKGVSRNNSGGSL